MGIGVIFIKQFINSHILALVVSGISGVVIYFITLIILKDENLLNTINLIKKRK